MLLLDHLHLVLTALRSSPAVLFQQLDGGLLVERLHALIVTSNSARVVRENKIFSSENRAVS